MPKFDAYLYSRVFLCGELIVHCPLLTAYRVGNIIPRIKKSNSEYHLDEKM
jgi:hypothetical protein